MTKLPLLKLLKETFVDLRPIVSYVGRWWLDFIVDLGVAVIHPLSLFLRGVLDGPALNLIRQLLVTLIRYPLQLVLTVNSLLLNALASFINNAFMSQSHERALNQQELHYLHLIYGDALQYNAIKIQLGGVKEKLQISPQAVGPDIFLRKFWGGTIVNDDLTLTPIGLRLLGHEACHVWQFQQSGAGYIGDSLMTQILDMLGRRFGVHWSDGYDLYAALCDKRNYTQCNVEQQAVMAELIGVACSLDASAHLTCEAFNRTAGFNVSESEFALVRDAHAELKGVQSDTLNNP